MLRKANSHFLLLYAAVAAALLLASSASGGRIHDLDKIHSCVTKAGRRVGQIRIIYAPSLDHGGKHLGNPAASCRRNEFEIDWYRTAGGGYGPAGPAGATGAIGPAGATGTIGPAGPAGAIGPAGPAGPVGAAGATGATGPAGPAGAIGPAGPAGATGAIGPAGATGATGATGAIGPAGPAGATGATGATGPAGAAGPQGPAGNSGVAWFVGAAGTVPSGNCLQAGPNSGDAGCPKTGGFPTDTSGLILGPMPAGGATISNLFAHSGTTPTGGETYTVEVLDNGASAFSCTVTSAGPTCSNTKSASIAEGDYLEVQITNNGGAADASWRVSFRY